MIFPKAQGVIVPMVLIAVILAAFVIILCLSYAVYRFAFYSPNRRQNNDYAIASTPQTDALHEDILRLIDAANALPYEAVSITSHDDLILSGRYYYQREGAPLNICFHGYRGTPSRDFSGGLQVMLRQGHNVLMIEQRAHCSSQGHTISFGIKERFDCLDWVRYALRRFGEETQILLVGISMGAATVLMASEMELPSQVVGIITDCPYSAPKTIIRKVCGDMKLPVHTSTWLACVSAKLFGHFDLTESTALEAVKHAAVPILLIHGEEDNFVPCQMSMEIQAARPDIIELQTFPGAGHGLSYLLDPEQIIRGFYQRILPTE